MRACRRWCARAIICSGVRRWQNHCVEARPSLALILGLAVALVGGAGRVGAIRRLFGGQWGPLAALGLIVLSWVVLLGWNNRPPLAPLMGFDRNGHLAYINYILQNKALPLGKQGTANGPASVVLSAVRLVARAVGLVTLMEGSLVMLRVFTLVIGIARMGLIFLCLRRLFPNQPGRQMVGLLIAGYLPENLCLAHHVTNETLDALLVTAALVSCSARGAGPESLTDASFGALADSGARGVSSGAATCTEAGAHSDREAPGSHADVAGTENGLGPGSRWSSRGETGAAGCRWCLWVGIELGLALLTEDFQPYWWCPSWQALWFGRFGVRPVGKAGGGPARRVQWP